MRWAVAILSMVAFSSWIPGEPLTPTGNAVLRARAAGSEIVLTTTARLAGAVHSLTWNGQEFIDSFDHGRQLQSASNLDCGRDFIPEVFNPTEAGSRFDGTGPRSSSKLLAFTIRDGVLNSRTQMAFWLRPGERSAGHLARNDRILSNHLLTRRIRIGIDGLPHVLDYRVTFTLPAGEKHTLAQFEALTGYMPPAFEVFEQFDPRTRKLEPLGDGPGEQSSPIVFSTRSGKHAMGIFVPEQPLHGATGPGYGRWRFRAEKVVKWNCVFRVRNRDGVRPGDYSYQLYVVVGDRTLCEQTMRTLHARFRSGQPLRPKGTP